MCSICRGSEIGGNFSCMRIGLGRISQCHFIQSTILDCCSFERVGVRRKSKTQSCNQKVDISLTAFLCLQHRNHCAVISMCTTISVPISMITTFPKPLAKSAGLCYNTNNLPRPCITHDSTGGISDHRTDHRWLWSTRRQRTRECQRAQKPALFRNKNG